MTALIGLCFPIGYAAYCETVGWSDHSPAIFSFLLIALGAVLAMVQIRTGFSLRGGSSLACRETDPVLYWLGVFVSTLAGVGPGSAILWVFYFG